jgi:hypothetical protein
LGNPYTFLKLTYYYLILNNFSNLLSGVWVFANCIGILPVSVTLRLEVTREEIIKAGQETEPEAGRREELWYPQRNSNPCWRREGPLS